jgi:hypothetical protein
MPDIFLGERRYIKNQVRVASDEFGESFGDRTPKLRLRASLEEGRSPPGPAFGGRGDLRGSDQLSASRLFIHNLDLLIDYLPMKRSITNPASPKHRAKVGCTQ